MVAPTPRLHLKQVRAGWGPKLQAGPSTHPLINNVPPGRCVISPPSQALIGLAHRMVRLEIGLNCVLVVDNEVVIK
jgi:hypothetical protein